MSTRFALACASFVLLAACSPAGMPAAPPAAAALPTSSIAAPRALFLAAKAGDNGLVPRAGMRVFGVALETRTKDGVVMTVALGDGTAAVYVEPGRSAVADAESEALSAATDAFIAAADPALANFSRTLPQPKTVAEFDPALAPALPPMDHAQFFALTDGGLRATVPVAIALIESDTAHPLRPLWDAGRSAREQILDSGKPAGSEQ